MTITRIYSIFLSGIIILVSCSTLADTGPCKLDAEHEVQICGRGDGAAIARVTNDKDKPRRKSFRSAIAGWKRTPDVLCHARPCAGYPCLTKFSSSKDVDARDEPGHDGVI